MIDIKSSLSKAMTTGDVKLGVNKTTTTLLVGECKLVLTANNCPKKTKEELDYYCRLSDTPFRVLKQNSLDLGALCSKPFPVSALVVVDEGDSDILKAFQ